MQEPQKDPTLGSWVRAALAVMVGAILVTAGLVWFTFTFIARPCCALLPG